MSNFKLTFLRRSVSNFKHKEIEDLMKTAKVLPPANHIWIYPELNQELTVDYCLKNGIAVSELSPLGTGSLVKELIAHRYWH